MDLSTAEPAKPKRSSRREENGPEIEGEGLVKWYNAEKGFGFIEVHGQERDVFIHATAVVRSGVNALSEGQRLIVKFAASKKGLEATSIQPRD